MTNYYRPYELVQRLDAIPTVTIHSFNEPFYEDNEWQAQIKIHFSDEFDKTAYEQVQYVIEDASNWTLEHSETPETDVITIYFSISDTMPTELLDKFGLN
jgi:hypothetical protein